MEAILKHISKLKASSGHHFELVQPGQLFLFGQIKGGVLSKTQIEFQQHGNLQPSTEVGKRYKETLVLAVELQAEETSIVEKDFLLAELDVEGPGGKGIAAVINGARIKYAILVQIIAFHFILGTVEAQEVIRQRHLVLDQIAFHIPPLRKKAASDIVEALPEQIYVAELF
jgi:hypothetical protein